MLLGLNNMEPRGAPSTTTGTQAAQHSMTSWEISAVSKRRHVPKTLQIAMMTTEEAVSMFSDICASFGTSEFHRIPKMYANMSAPEPNLAVRKPPAIPKMQANAVKSHGKLVNGILRPMELSKSKRSKSQASTAWSACDSSWACRVHSRW